MCSSDLFNEPDVNGSRPTMVLNRVDLPTPFGPITPTIPLFEHDKNSKAASKVLLAGKVGRFVRLCGYVFPGLMILGDYLRGTLSFTEIR